MRPDIIKFRNTVMGDKNPFKFIDLFAGIGGFRIPFDNLGGECVFSSEWDRFSQQTYHANFGKYPEGDITAIPVTDIPYHDILLAGFPCQPFSHAGLKKGFSDTRGSLFFDILRILNHLHPRIVFLENVKAFKTHDNGLTFKTVTEKLKATGYEVFDKVLNARNFGLPQNRDRIYIVALHKKKVSDLNFKFPPNLKQKKTVKDILEKTVDEKYTISDRLWMSHQRRRQKHRANGNGFGYSLFDKTSEYTSTISARYYKDGSEILIKQKGRNPRKLTPREAARLQGFPETFKIPVSDTQSYRQFGNAVPVPVIREIAKSIITHIQK